ncbi:hypothetical protein J6I44_15545 [Aliifodinibius sp. 1BSP15-2V2]|uniref:Lipoprotein n=1 Tax=Fodinibius salsisoli TaxID=2820877 RepID=A0ABT3PQZ2_9BACT|nr:hypothetical protein [Fodinibius salsisoli]MCW9708280.1 hypothetical protein [Fodinibius salsisoli]
MKNQPKHYLQAFIVVIIAIIFSACSHGQLLIEGERGAAAIEVHQNERHHDNEYYRERAPRIPPGHMPPPGSCRIWYPNTPPGHQPPPGDCYQLSQRVPPEAWLIRG